MPNRYTNLVGSKKISDDFENINVGFDRVQGEMDTNKTSAATHIADTTSHVTSADKTTWNSKAPGSTQTDLLAHTSNTDIHVTTTDKTNWNSKASGSTQTDLTAHVGNETIHVTKGDHDKLNGIEAKAEVNQNTFASINNVSATNKTDAITFEGGTGIVVTTNPTTKKVTWTATGEATPGPHGGSHDIGGSDPNPGLVALRADFDKLTPQKIGAETPTGAQAKADIVQANVDALTPASIGAETPAGAQAKVDVLGTVVAAHLAEYTQHVSDYIKHPGIAKTSGTLTAYTVTLDPVPASIPEFFGITIIPHMVNGANPTLNVNGKGAAALKDQKGVAYPAGKLLAGKPYTFRKVGLDFLADSGSGGGEYGTAGAADVLPGKTIATESGLVAGTYSNIKSIQRGSAAPFANTTTKTVTVGISPVNIAKSIVRFHYSPYMGNANDMCVSIELINSTQIVLTREGSNLPSWSTLYWDVIEFNNVKSLQSGSVAVAGSVAISAVDTSKSLCFLSQRSSVLSPDARLFMSGVLFIDNKTLHIDSANGVVRVYWQLIEFN